MNRYIRLLIAVAIALVAPYVVGFDTHGLPVMLLRYHPTAKALWVGLSGDPLILVSSGVHLIAYATGIYILLQLVGRRRRARAA